MIKIGLLHTTIRGDEKLIIAAALKKKVKLELLDVAEMIFGDNQRYNFNVVLERCISTVKGMYAIHYFEKRGIPVVNGSKIATICEDKFLTNLTLSENNVPQPKFAMAFEEEKVLEAIDRIGGFPVVLKPPLGSWGRLLSKINDRDALETILEHKKVLGTPPHSAFYIQEYVEKGGRDIRAFVIDGMIICAIYRDSEHWITNTARGGQASNCPVTSQLSKICKDSARAVGGGVLAIDLIESDRGLLVNEINHTMEFKNSEVPTGVSISGAIVDYCIKTVKHVKK